MKKNFSTLFQAIELANLNSVSEQLGLIKQEEWAEVLDAHRDGYPLLCLVAKRGDLNIYTAVKNAIQAAISNDTTGTLHDLWNQLCKQVTLSGITKGYTPLHVAIHESGAYTDEAFFAKLYDDALAAGTASNTISITPFGPSSTLKMTPFALGLWKKNQNAVIAMLTHDNTTVLTERPPAPALEDKAFFSEIANHLVPGSVTTPTTSSTSSTSRRIQLLRDFEEFHSRLLASEAMSTTEGRGTVFGPHHPMGMLAKAVELYRENKRAAALESAATDSTAVPLLVSAPSSSSSSSTALTKSDVVIFTSAFNKHKTAQSKFITAMKAMFKNPDSPKFAAYAELLIDKLGELPNEWDKSALLHDIHPQLSQAGQREESKPSMQQ